MNDRIEVLKEIIAKVLPYLFKDGEMPAAEVENQPEAQKCSCGDCEECQEDSDEMAPEMPTKKREPKIVELSMSTIVPKKQEAPEGKQSIMSELLGKKPRK